MILRHLAFSISPFLGRSSCIIASYFVACRKFTYAPIVPTPEKIIVLFGAPSNLPRAGRLSTYKLSRGKTYHSYISEYQSSYIANGPAYILCVTLPNCHSTLDSSNPFVKRSGRFFVGLFQWGLAAVILITAMRPFLDACGLPRKGLGEISSGELLIALMM